MGVHPTCLLLRSNLPLWLALAFHELAPIVAILDLLRSQLYQWRAAWAVRTSLHGKWTTLGPRGVGGLKWSSTYRPKSPEKKKQRSGSSRCCRISSRRKGRQGWARTTNNSRGSPLADRPSIQRSGVVHVIQRREACTQPALGIPSRRPHLRAVAWH